MSIKKQTEDIRGKFESKSFDKFIHEIHFPKFKNFAPDAQISFNFPITVIVGPNGGGKSSVLHALWGTPQKHSTSRFWFSTPVDPIDSASDDQHRYWYSHYVKGIDRIVQSRKMSGNKRHGYWEPTRPNQSEGMGKMPSSTPDLQPYMSKSGDRWNQVEKTPIYINSKAESSAFERFFYYSNIDSLESKQDHFVRYSNKLREAIDQNLGNLSYYSVQRVFANFMIPQSTLTVINKILGKEYLSARYVIHDLYGKIRSPSVIFQTPTRNYSECFAGSGELAIVNTVLALEKLDLFDLLLLDEPETSLHPGAQRRFLEYLLQVVSEKLVQVVISTHSPTFVDLLPEKALVVLDDSPEGVRARPNPTKAGAFHRLGQPAPNRTLLLAEDPLLAAFVATVHAKLPPEIRSRTDVEPATVGASEMLSNQVKAYSLSRSKVIMILDGDQKAVADIFSTDPLKLSPLEKSKLISSLKGLDVSLVGGDGFFDEWASWCREHVLFIDQVCAEQILLMCLDKDHSLLADPSATNKKFKSAVRGALAKDQLEVDAKSMATTFRTLLTHTASLNPAVATLLADFSVKLVAAITRLDR